MAVTYQGAVGPTVNDPGNYAITVPSGASAGDFLLAMLICGDSGASWTVPNADWTELFDYSDGTFASMSLAWAYVTSGGNVDASSTQTWTCTNTTQHGGQVMIHLSGTHATTPIDGSTSQFATSFPHTRSLTTGTANCFVVDISGMETDADYTPWTVSTTPSETTTTRVDYYSGAASSDYNMSVITWTKATAGSTQSDISGTGSPNDIYHNLVSIAPAAADTESLPAVPPLRATLKHALTR